MGDNFIIGDFGGKIDLMVGFSTSVDTELDTGQNVVGNSWDDTYMYYSRYSVGTIYQCVGFSLSVNASFDIHGNGLRGISIDDSGNIISVNRNDDTVYLHSGFSSSTTDSFTTGGDDEHGATWDGTNAIVICRNSSTYSTLHLMTGFSGSEQSSFSITTAATKSGRDTTWDGTNVYTTDIGNETMTQNVGFSSSVNSTLSSPYANPNGATWHNAEARFGQVVAEQPAILFGCNF